jgi:pyruvate dehydrogenase (quinone)
MAPLGVPAHNKMSLGNPEFGCALSPIDFVAFAKACGAGGFRCTRPDEVRPRLPRTNPRPRLREEIVYTAAAYFAVAVG